MKKTLLLFWLVLPCSLFAQSFNPKSVVPANLAKYTFGMPLETFKLKNKTAKFPAEASFSFRIEAVDIKAGKNYKSVTYYFDNENNKPLYEMIIEFKTEALKEAFIKAKLKAPNAGTEWKWTTAEGYTFKAWGFGKSLVFALALPSTEWNEKKK